MKLKWIHKVGLPVVLLMGLLFSGCGDKIAIPQPEGLFSISAYIYAADFEIDDPRQLTVLQGSVFLLQGNTLSKRDQGLGMIDYVDPVTGFVNATALCGDTDLDLVFVYDQGDQSVSWYTLDDLQLMGSSPVPEVPSVVSMVTADNGLEQVPAAETFLYLGDDENKVIHRYAFDPILGLSPYGILANSTGESARFVHEVQGMARDPEGMLLVCDADTTRNWVIRFDSEPDLTDVTVDPDDDDLLRGLAVTFRTLPCEPQPTAAFVLGDAPDCGETSWQGGTSSELGEFHTPTSVAVDGSGRAFVSDSENNRVQLFLDGVYTLAFTIDPEIPVRATNISVVDRVVNPGLTHYAAYVYLVAPDDNRVWKFISYEELAILNPGTPPPPQ